MRYLAWVVVCALVTAVGMDAKTQPFPGVDQNPDTYYKRPNTGGPVVELIDEDVDNVLPVLHNNWSGEAVNATREDRDVFAGVEAVRVTGVQRYRSLITGWEFRIVENPRASEYRFIRFAWKKVGGTGIMVQLHSKDPEQWNHRYYAGKNTVNFAPAKQVSDKLPGEWEIVTRDLYKDWGAFTITGIALTSMDGTAGLFDHVLLGRTVEDLDKATETALGKVKPEKAIDAQERIVLWNNLMSADRVKAAAAQRTFLATAPDHVAFLREKLGEKPADKDQAQRIQKLLADLDADAFDTRQNATDELIKIGPPAVEAVRAFAAKASNDEVRYRTRLILRKVDPGGNNAPVSTAGRLVRVVRVLQRAGTKDARALLVRLADGEFGADVVPDAKGALVRLPNEPKPK